MYRFILFVKPSSKFGWTKTDNFYVLFHYD
jgi:hypothetical protein